MLTFMQMFKYLLLGAMEDLIVIFNDSEAAPATEVRQRIDAANAKAAPVWEDGMVPLSDRSRKCREILDPALRVKTKRPETSSQDFKPAPVCVGGKLSQIFKEHYGKSDALMLIGRTDNRAYEVQDRYEREVGEVLGKLKPQYESRAITRLGKVYGRGSLPLLCMSSVWGLWRLCQSAFYTRQLSLVSLVRPLCQSPRLASPKLYRWIQPFAGSSSMRRVGCDYASSVQRFLQPVSVKRITTLSRVWFLVPLPQSGSDQTPPVLPVGSDVVHPYLPGLTA